MSDITIFNNPEFGQIRTSGTADNPLFCLSDVCKTLGLDSSQVMKRLDNGVVSIHPIVDSLGRQQNANFINEDGLYDVILDSRKPEAKKFRKWITSEVLPVIRKHGGYMRIMDNESDEDLMARALVVARATLKRREEHIKQLEMKVEQDAPKVEFFDCVAESKDAVEMKAVANTLNYISVGRNKLFSILREQKILLQNNLPYQKYIDAGYFRTVEVKKNCGTEIRVFVKTVVYQRGLDYIRKLLNKLGYKPKEEIKQTKIFFKE